MPSTDIYNIILYSFKTSLTYTLKLSIIVLVSMFIMNYIINTGIMKRVSEIILPITKHLNINTLSMSSILTCLFSPTVGYSILAEGLKNNKLSEKEVIATSLANSFPSVISHTFTFFVPIVIPILGLTGLLFLFIRLGVAFAKTIIGMVYLNIISKSNNHNNNSEDLQINNMNTNKNLKNSLYSTLKFSKRLIPIMFITMFLVMFLSNMGVFNHLNNIITPITNILNLNPNVGLIALTEVINVQGAIIMAGGLLNENILNSKEVLIGLVIGNVITLSSRYAKHSLPLHVSLFGVKLGTKIVMINSIITLLLDILIIGVILLL
ncbi:hypothetical protein KKP91_00950 [Methanothermococcus sp. SCGC AD-155-M21]|nr:hypothetical protein [Methanothermococcus sp. SCGC AD-155-M21]